MKMKINQPGNRTFSERTHDILKNSNTEMLDFVLKLDERLIRKTETIFDRLPGHHKVE